MNAVDALRPPSAYDATADAYKDWLHCNVFEFERGTVGIVNASLHGRPDDLRAVAVGVALVHSPEHGWIGEVETGARADASVGRAGIGLARMAVALGPRGDVHLGVRDSDARLAMRGRAEPATRAIDTEGRPFGSGWIAWRAVPRLLPHGRYVVADRPIDLRRAAVYHDHNWGRWHWGDDIGWEWGAFLTPAGDAFVFAVVTDRTHRSRGRAMLTHDAHGRRRTWGSAQIHCEASARLERLDRRLPGALAALYSDRARPALPRSVTIGADDGFDRIEINFEAESALQLITSDPAKRGYSFIHELVGDFFYRGRLRGARVAGWGRAVFEYVD